MAACGLLAVDVCGEVRYDDTLAHATRALEADPSNVKALFRRGKARALLDELDAAKADMLEAAKREPQNRDVRRELAALKARMGAQDQRDKAVFVKMFA